MNLQEIKKQQEKKHSELFKQCGVFFAFSNEQFNENKTPLQEGEKYVSIGMGGYLPKGKVKAFCDGMDEIKKWYKQQVADNKEMRRNDIVYQLGNHECWYTYDIEPALAALGPEYTKKEVLKVFNEEHKNQVVS
jgi:hypothetical protein